MNENDHFEQAILDNPEDISTRLVYADWLEERGDARAEYIRLEVELSQCSKPDENREKKRARLEELRKTVDRKWAIAVGLVRITAIEDLVFYLREFHQPWMENPALDTAAIPDDLPYGLSLIYQEFGRLLDYDPVRRGRTPFAAQDALIGPRHLERINGMIAFVWENQGVWSCRFPLGEKDPAVFSDAPDIWQEPSKGFQKVCDSLNHFLITLCLQEAVMSAPCLVAVDGPSPKEILKVPCRSIWPRGHYVQGEPDRDFLDVPHEDVLIMEWSGMWLGSHSDKFLRLLKRGTEYNRIY